MIPKNKINIKIEEQILLHLVSYAMVLNPK